MQDKRLEMRHLLGSAIGLLPLLGVAAVALAAVAVAVEARLPPTGTGGGRAALLDAALALSLVAIAVVTLVPIPVEDPADWVRLNLVPFGDLIRSFDESPASVPGEVAHVLGNVVLFAPLGFLAALRNRGVDIRRFVVAAALLSIAIEVAQYLEAMGREADVTDVIANTAGAAIGFAAASQLRGRSTPRNASSHSAE